MAALTAKYETSLELAAEPLKELGNSYVAQLEKLKQAAQKKGDLELVLVIDAEIKTYADEGERDFSKNRELAELRRIYELNHQRRSGSVEASQKNVLHQAVEKFAALSRSLTQVGDLEAAVRSEKMRKEIADRLENFSVIRDDEKTHRVVVSSLNNKADPLRSGVTLKNGQTCRLKPNRNDEWTGGGSKRGVYCDYRGYPGKSNQWMRMFYRIGDSGSIEAVDPEKVVIAPAEGELLLFVEDALIAGNDGEIRVAIVLNPEVGDE